MKAIVFHQHGAPDVLKYEDAPEPRIRSNEVLVLVKACALNHLDLWVRRGIPGVPIPLPTFPAATSRVKLPKSARMSPPYASARKSSSLPA